MKKILEKFRRRMPAWMEVYCIKKGWIFPTPKVYGDTIIISELEMVHRIDPVLKDVYEKMADQMFKSIFYNYRKYQYFPNPEQLDVYRQDRPDGNTYFTWSILAYYCPSLTFYEVIGVMEALNNIRRKGGDK